MSVAVFTKPQLIFKILCISNLYLHYFPIKPFPFYIFTLFEDYLEVNYYTVFQLVLAVTVDLTPKKCNISIVCCEFSMVYRVKECTNKGN